MNHWLIMQWRVIKAGFISFLRNATLAFAAIAIMVVTLSIILFSIITNATFTNTVAQITSKINISLYLKDSVTKDQTDTLIRNLKALPNVESITYLDKAHALAAYEKQNVGNNALLQAVNETGNPIPATIQIKPKDLNKINDIRSYITKPQILAMQSDPASDNGDRRAAIDKITHATNLLREAGVVAVLVFAVISALIIFNTIRLAIFNRRDELQIMRLLGASTWFIRGPFVVESIIYGVLSAIISVLLINALFVASSTALQATSLGLLDISYSQTYFLSHYWALLTMQLVLGIFIGAASSVIATQRYLRFKTSKK